MSSDDKVTIRLVHAAQQGDRTALEALYARYLDRAHALVRLRLGPRLRRKLDSMDILQEAMLASLRDLDGLELRTQNDFFHWLCRLVENRIRDQADHFAAQKRDIAKERPLQPIRPSYESMVGPLAEAASRRGPLDLLAQAEELQRLEQAVDALPPPQREALLLVRYEGLSLQEAGQIMDKSPDAVRMLVARAIVELSKTLRPVHE